MAPSSLSPCNAAVTGSAAAVARSWPLTARVTSIESGTAIGRPSSRKQSNMSLFIDVHTIECGVTLGDAAGAHAADLATQERFGVKYLQYWVNEAEGKVVCLVEAPSAEAAVAVHKEAHGLLADQIFEVTEGA